MNTEPVKDEGNGTIVVSEDGGNGTILISDDEEGPPGEDVKEEGENKDLKDDETSDRIKTPDRVKTPENSSETVTQTDTGTN